MSKKIFITAAIGLIGTAVGFVIGSKWTEKNLKDELEEVYTKEFEMIKKDLEEKYENKANADKEMAEEASKMQEGIKKARENGANKERMNRYHPDLAEIDEFEEEIDKENDISEDKGPYMISYEEFYENKEYDEKSMTWDPELNILTEDGNEAEPIEDIDELVSYEALDILESSKTNEIYVRNDVLKTDFVISRYDPR